MVKGDIAFPRNDKRPIIAKAMIGLYLFNLYMQGLLLIRKHLQNIHGRIR